MHAQCTIFNPVIIGTTSTSAGVSVVGQSFTATSGCGNLYISSVVIYSITSHTDVILTIFEGDGSSGTQIYQHGGEVITGAVNFSLATTIPLVSNVQLTAGNMYTFQLSFPSGNPSTFQLGKVLADTYAGGILYENNSGIGGEDLTFMVNTTNTSLPVELVNFDAKIQDAQVRLNWKTASEQNNAGFEVEHSMNGHDWETIGFVNGNVTTTEIMQYQFVDMYPDAGVNYYRLHQIDFNGDYEYSKVQSVKLEFTDNASIFPNPAQPGSILTIGGLGENVESVMLMDFNGRQILQKSNVNDESLKLDLPSYLPIGFYTLAIISEGKKQVQKIVVQ
ncbi:MAG: T9SS type A sorting domain-containing protein [Bacteroidetes bacterium]|nr:T9SS type A sorting domain-containing protein [Bacteroidota bacterium]